jgi:hypothetical protein
VVVCDGSRIVLSHTLCTGGYSCVERDELMWKRDGDGEDGEDGEDGVYAQCQKQEV